jgi:hypothetical protein
MPQRGRSLATDQRRVCASCAPCTVNRKPGLCLRTHPRVRLGARAQDVMIESGTYLLRYSTDGRLKANFPRPP